MSVLLNKRKESLVQYITTAILLTRYTLQMCIKLPKRLTILSLQDFVHICNYMLLDVLKIKQLYQQDDDKCLRRRIHYENNCLAKLDYLDSYLDIIYINCDNAFKVQEKTSQGIYKKSENEDSKRLTTNQWETWLSFINKEILLIKGLRTKDTKKLKEIIELKDN